MTHYDLIRDRLDECHVMFPSYNDRGVKELDVLAGIFARSLSDWTESEVNAAFDVAIGGDTFPVLGKILAYKATQTAYRFDYGPLGFGAIYAENHPYVRKQMAQQADISGYRVEVTANEARTLQIEADNAPRITFDNSEEQAPEIDRGNSGFRQIGRAL